MILTQGKSSDFCHAQTITDASPRGTVPVPPIIPFPIPPIGFPPIPPPGTPRPETPCEDSVTTKCSECDGQDNWCQSGEHAGCPCLSDCPTGDDEPTCSAEDCQGGEDSQCTIVSSTGSTLIELTWGS